MVVTEENVRRLSRYAGISEEEARAALDAAGGDALEALALLERQGRIRLDTAAGRARIPALLTRPLRRNRSRSGRAAFAAG